MEPHQLILFKAFMKLDQTQVLPLCREQTKILDFGAGSGLVGEFFSKMGFNQVYGQEGSTSRVKHLETLPYYQEIERYLIGRHRLPSKHAKSFDLVTFSGNINRGAYGKIIFKEMLNALKPGGFMLFSIDEKYLNKSTDHEMDYVDELNELVKNQEMSFVFE